MEFTDISKKEFLDFIKDLYKNDPFFKNNKKGIIDIVCNEKGEFYKNSKQKIVAVKKDSDILCQAVFIKHKNYNAVSVAFFEAVQNCRDAVELLIFEAERFAKNNNCKKIIIGLDGHCNNSLGFSIFNDSFPSFGEAFTKPYYSDYFKDLKPIKFVSFCDSKDNVSNAVFKDIKKIEQKMHGFNFEYADFNNFYKTMKEYTDLNNEIFADHNYYFYREYGEDLELFLSMKPLLKPENLIFAKKDGKNIGFILWYPDFNMLVRKGKGAGASTFLKYRLFKIYPKSAKVVEIGILKKYRNTGLILKLFHLAIEVVNKKYKNTNKIISSWIMDSNFQSKGVTRKYTQKPYKDFIIYEKELLD